MGDSLLKHVCTMTPLHAHADEFSVTRGLNLGLHPYAVLVNAINAKISCAKRSILVSSRRARI